jgi:hypothetical protein
MATCSNCKKSLSCGCQKRKASNGTMVCTNCISAYEKANRPKSTVTTTHGLPLPVTEWTTEQMQSAVSRLNNFKNKLKG